MKFLRIEQDGKKKYLRCLGELLERSALYQDIYNSQIKKGALDNE